MITVKAANPNTPAIAALVAQLDDYQLSLYPETSNHLDPVAELAGPRVYFAAAREGQTLLGCGAIKYPRGRIYGEIKRLFVAAGARGRGVAGKIMAGLEENARRKKVGRIVLETGIHQPEAIALYARLGYRRRGPFGGYADDPLSVFMEKTLPWRGGARLKTTRRA